MKKSFEERMSRLMEATGATSDSSLARTLEIRPPSVAAARKRGQIPSGWIERVAETFGVNADWLFFGLGPMRDNGRSENSWAEEKAMLLEKIKILQDRLEEKDNTIRVLSMAINALQKQSAAYSGNLPHPAASLTDLAHTAK